ncbi:NifB/NifX family molybdenum-iron cluster-binding protein [Pyrolobus fumarii]|uniref:NifB/NifX family molybdenum-iron cluster-binding protein n=1 Tax=Pyrolobus fumarii TaxID=54252 RepID=UPI001FCBEC5E|nr:NifB/NifX family molybdenum-iron cluster-binding protein [Pyrolobus fumarii]
MCIPTDDGIKVRKGEPSRAAHILIYEWTGNRWQLVLRLQNPYRNASPGDECKLAKLLSQHGCETLVATLIRDEEKTCMQNANLEIVTVEPGAEIWDALNKLSSRHAMEGKTLNPQVGESG